MAEPDAVPQKSRAGRIAGPKKCPHPLTLDAIEETDEEFRIGAMAALRQMETHAGFDAYSCGAIKAAFQDIVGVQFRNGATPGGSLWRRMGFSDIVTAFLAMDSYVELHQAGIVSLEQFANMRYDNDVLVRLIVRKRPGAFAYRAVRKQRTDLLTLNCMVAKLGDEYRVTMGARPGHAVLLRDDQDILADGISEASTAAFAEHAAGSIRVSGNMWGSVEYRRALAPVLVRRALLMLGEVR